MTGRWVALATAVLAVFGSFAAPRVLLNAGPLVEGHAKIAGDCLKCHALLAGLPSAKCIDCHPLDKIGSQAEPGATAEPERPALAGMHREFASVPCLECHTDHAGADPTRATRRFTHEALSAGLRARCAGCHAARRPDDELHRGAGDACGSCHDTAAWKPATFEHGKFFLLDRDHNATCSTCHGVVGDWRKYTCYGCHEHTPANVMREHREEAVTDLDNCVRCHRSASEHGERGEGRREGEGRGDRQSGERHEEGGEH